MKVLKKNLPYTPKVILPATGLLYLIADMLYSNQNGYLPVLLVLTGLLLIEKSKILALILSNILNLSANLDFIVNRFVFLHKCLL